MLIVQMALAAAATEVSQAQLDLTSTLIALVAKMSTKMLLVLVFSTQQILVRTINDSTLS